MTRDEKKNRWTAPSPDEIRNGQPSLSIHELFANLKPCGLEGLQDLIKSLHGLFKPIPGPPLEGKIPDDGKV